MAAHGSWAPAYQSIWTHRKTFELAALLGLNETYAAAHVLRLVGWAIDNAPDGDLSRLSDRAIAYGAGWTQEVSLFVAALAKAGFLDDDRRIHDWYDYAGKLIERRQDDAVRKQKSRGHAPDVRGTSNGLSGLVRRREEHTTEEQRRPEETTVSSPPPPPQAEGERPPRRRRDRAAAAEPAKPTEPEVLAPIRAGDAELWQHARLELSRDMLPANAAKLELLELVGRGPDGGLRLRAPPGTIEGSHWRGGVARALCDAGDADGARVAIVDG